MESGASIKNLGSWSLVLGLVFWVLEGGRLARLDRHRPGKSLSPAYGHLLPPLTTHRAPVLLELLDAMRSCKCYSQTIDSNFDRFHCICLLSLRLLFFFDSERTKIDNWNKGVCPLCQRLWYFIYFNNQCIFMVFYGRPTFNTEPEKQF